MTAASNNATEAEAARIVELSQGEFLKYKMALESLSATGLAKELGVHAQTIRNATSGARPISSSLALKLSRRFVEPVDIWLQNPVRVRAADVAEMALAAKRSKAAPKIATEQQPPLFAGQLSYDLLLVDADIKRLLFSEESSVSITPVVEENIQPASYDLTIGLMIEHGFRALSEHEWVQLLRREFHEVEQSRALEQIDAKRSKPNFPVKFDSHRIVLGPMGKATIIARELVSFGPNYIAEVGGTATNAMRGLLVNHGFQIDPGYQGPIVVTVMNIGSDDIELLAGQKIVSLAIRRLAQAPKKAYLADIEERVLRIGQQIEQGIRKLFVCTGLADDERVKAYSTVLDDEHIGPSEDDALDMAIAAFLERLQSPESVIQTSDPFAIEAVRILGGVAIDKKEAEALIRYLAVRDEGRKMEVDAQFRRVGEAKTLGHVLTLLKVNPIEAINRIMQNST